MIEAKKFVQCWRATQQARDYCCFYCGVETISKGNSTTSNRRTKEHLIPKERFGRFVVKNKDFNNVVWACQECNSCRNSLTIDEFRASKYWQGMRRPLFFCEEILLCACPSEQGTSRAYRERAEGIRRQRIKETVRNSRTPKENLFLSVRGYAAKYFSYTDDQIEEIVDGFFKMTERNNLSLYQVPKNCGWVFSKMKDQPVITSEILYQSYFEDR